MLLDITTICIRVRWSTRPSSYPTIPSIGLLPLSECINVVHTNTLTRGIKTDTLVSQSCEDITAMMASYSPCNDIKASTATRYSTSINMRQIHLAYHYVLLSCALSHKFCNCPITVKAKYYTKTIINMQQTLTTATTTNTWLITAWNQIDKTTDNWV